MTLKAPFPYFGGKSRIAPLIWDAFGRDVPNYVEPFCGSAAMLLARPGGAGKVETINDADGFVSNFWRSMVVAPDEVAHHADWPVNEADLHARNLWLRGERERITERLMGDPEWCDPRAAGWWVWVACVAIGSDATAAGPWRSVDGVLTRGPAGCGVPRSVPSIASVSGVIAPSHVGWDSVIAERMVRVQVACGDWARVCQNSGTIHHGATGVLLDPPYEEGQGYHEQRDGIAAEVWDWATGAGANPLMRIAVCGYEDGRTVPDGWRTVAWKAAGGYGGGKGNAAADNSSRERVWLSPHCINGGQMGLGL